MRDDWERMTDTESPNSHKGDTAPEGGILAALPRSRPQRASPRRTAARNAAGRSKTVASPGKQSAHRHSAAQTATRTVEPVKATKAKASKPIGARATKKAAIAPKPTPATKPVANSKPAPTKRRVAKIPKPSEPPVPKQGYEPEEEVELGSTVNPPSGVELAESVVDIVGELANSGLAAGGRLLKDAFSLLRRP